MSSVPLYSKVSEGTFEVLMTCSVRFQMLEPLDTLFASVSSESFTAFNIGDCGPIDDMIIHRNISLQLHLQH